MGRVPWLRAKKNFFSPRVAMLLLVFLFLSEGAAEGGTGLALTPSSALKCKGEHEVGGEACGGKGGLHLRALWAPDGPAPMPCGIRNSQIAERKAKWTSAGHSARVTFRENSSDKTLGITLNCGFTQPLIHSFAHSLFCKKLF